MSDYLILECPHCKSFIQIYLNEINCAIFRHGVYKSNMKQIPPHTCKTDCDTLISNNLIYGCSKPFKIVKTTENNNDVNLNYKLEICDYI